MPRLGVISGDSDYREKVGKSLIKRARKRECKHTGFATKGTGFLNELSPENVPEF
jgi:hypothetical protein